MSAKKKLVKKPTNKKKVVRLCTPIGSGDVEVFICIGKNGINKNESNFLTRKLTAKITQALALSMKPFYNVYPHEIIVK